MTATKSIRVAVAGARGRTGGVVAAALKKAPGIEVVAALVRPGTQHTNGEFSDLKQLAAHAKPDVLVDFTVFPDSKHLALQAISLGIRPVIGTSGYLADDIDELSSACRRAKVGGIIAANFSIGAVLMMRFAETAARYFDHAEIIETHHAEKKDAPSGTALATAKRIASAGEMKRASSDIVKADGARGATFGGVGIHSIRLPGIISTQEVEFASEDEMLVLRHSTSTQAAFVPGVLKAIRAVGMLDHLVVGLEELMR
jgi:4-hydroxy-tetrahydrodipicolinate reductase